MKGKTQTSGKSALTALCAMGEPEHRAPARLVEKNTPLRDAKYLAFVRSLPSCISKTQGCEAHHPIGERFSQHKCSDYAAIPLTTAEHAELHRGWKAWEAKHGSQWMHATRTLLLAIDKGFPFPTGERKQPRLRAPTGTALTSSKIVPRPYA